MLYYLMIDAENDALVGASISWVILLAVTFIVNIILWLYYKGQPKVDQGFCLAYYKLSYRRRLKRDLWEVPVAFVFLILFCKYISSYLSVAGILIISLLLLLCIIQPIYNFKMWKRTKLREEHENGH